MALTASPAALLPLRGRAGPAQGGNMHGNSNPSGPDHGMQGKDAQTGEPLNPNHWDELR
jgi:hypothetical protein